MTYSFIVPGRGSWSQIGGYLPIRATSTNPTGYLRAPAPGSKERMVGSSFASGVQTTFPFEVACEAVKALQRLVNVPADGYFGPKTGAAVMAVQGLLGVTIDGVVGPDTAAVLFEPFVMMAARKFGVLESDLRGIMLHESSADPGAVGAVTGSDVGPFQINLDAPAATKLSIANAVDPDFSSEWTASAMADFIDLWTPKVGGTLAAIGAVANHNSPRQAQLWMERGAAQVDWIKQYVDDVRAAGKQG